MNKGFVYIWHDTKRKMFYIGSHKGTEDDGYICSNKRLQTAYSSRPESFKRRILEWVTFSDHGELLSRENYWLSMIKPEELCYKRYYNEKRVAAGGDIVSTLPAWKRNQHKQRSIEARQRGYRKWLDGVPSEERTSRAKHARSCVKHPRGGVFFGEDNPFFGKCHSDETKKKMSQSAKQRKPSHIKKYEIVFPDDSTEIHLGMQSIRDKHCSVSPFKFERFINTNRECNSNRKTFKNHPLAGAIIKELS